jgi:protein phosphatase
MHLNIPELSLVILIGASGCGKSTFARKYFKETEILSSDHYRGVVSDDETDQSASKDAFEILHYIAAKRLAAGRLTVIDATNVQPEDRKKLIQIAKQYHVFPIAIAFNLPEQICHERNAQRPDRNFGPHVVKRHTQTMRRSLKSLHKEGFHRNYILNSVEQIEQVEIDRQPLWNNLHTEHGPFDIIGDIHGCCDELEQLLEQLGYQLIIPLQGAESAVLGFPQVEHLFKTGVPDRAGWVGSGGSHYSHPEGRKVIFLGDLVDRGPRILDTIALVQNMIKAGQAFCVVGNHDDKLLRQIQGKNVKINHGLENSIAEIEELPTETKADTTKDIQGFLESLISHYILDDGKLVVAHAGLKQELQGRGSGAVRAFAMYGETTGEIDEFGLPVRHNWAAEYRGQAMVVYGHTPVPEPVWLNNTIDLDTGCVFGGKLTALRYPERELVSVPAAKVYCEPIRPLLDTITTLSAQQDLDDLLDLEDVLGKRRIDTRLQPNITIREENAIAALEAMSRFAANPKWLIYLPPTMSPVATSNVSGFLEYPTEALSFYKSQDVTEVVCEEKHMGSRAIAIVCQSEAVAERRFGVLGEGIGICYTRTGRKFFNDDKLEIAFIDRIHQALTNSNFWQELETDWVCLDCELMPWSAKAQELIRQQYAPVGIASRLTLSKSTELLDRAQSRGVDVGSDVEKYRSRYQLAEDYTAAYRRYCWTVNSLEDLKLAPFHILATEGKVHTDKTHLWHIQQISKFCQADPKLLLATNYRVISLEDNKQIDLAVDWWLDMTKQGGEGMVVKPMNFIVKGSKGVLQPAVKCRGQEYLRIIYGAEYTLPDNLGRLRKRGLSLKRSLASREFALGIEALQRFVDREPLRRIHECVFAILALESQPIDPRL